MMVKSWSWWSILNLHELSFLMSNIDLTRTVDLDHALAHHLSPVGNPANRSSNSKDNIEHVIWNLDALHQQSRKEVNVRIKISLLEVVIIQSLLLQSQGNIQQVVVFAIHVLPKVNKQFLENLGSGIVVFEDTVTKSI